MALSRTVPSPGSTGWFPVARAADVGGAPIAVGAGGRPYVVLRLRPGAEVTALSARCPHRLAPLTTGSVVDGTLECAHHGWRFTTDGRCVDIPSLGVDGTPPPRADLSAPWAVEERDGWVWIAPERTVHHRPPRAVAHTTADPVPVLPGPTGPVLGNLDASLEHAWHPVALAVELREGGWLAVRLLGRTWTLERTGGEVTAAAPAWGVRELWGVVWLAPAEPRGADLGPADPGGTWLPAVRTSVPAAVLADALLDPTPAVPEVVLHEGGFAGTWAGGRADVATPFQVRRRDDGTSRTVLVLLQPEDADSTRVYVRVTLPGASRAERAAAVAQQRTELAADLRLLERADSPGLPLTMRAELHVPADRLGVALRRTLADWVVGVRATGAAAPGPAEDQAAA